MDDTPKGFGHERFPHGTIEITSVPELHQADCQRCGWHTRQSPNRPWIASMAREHFKVCPRPYFRFGATMECGCWWYAQLLTGVGSKATCPLHGETVMVKANVEEPVAYGSGEWTPTEEV